MNEADRFARALDARRLEAREQHRRELRAGRVSRTPADLLADVLEELAHRWPAETPVAVLAMRVDAPVDEVTAAVLGPLRDFVYVAPRTAHVALSARGIDLLTHAGARLVGAALAPREG